VTDRVERRVELTRIYHFSAGHRLENPALSSDANAALYGQCARPHGHNYYIEVTVGGTPDPLTGMAVDLGHLDEVVRRSVLDEVDHQTLEQVPSLARVITTGESLARAFWGVLDAALPPGMLARITVQETAKNRFEYRGEGAGKGGLDA
jgi:6-pyruvoyltetrahydropterin/6-carboxytetrahydropterin synthase